MSMRNATQATERDSKEHHRNKPMVLRPVYHLDYLPLSSCPATALKFDARNFMEDIAFFGTFELLYLPEDQDNERQLTITK